MVKKETIEEIFNNVISSSSTKNIILKCSKKELRKKDIEFIEYFKQHMDEYANEEDEGDLYEAQDKIQNKHTYPIEQKKVVSDWGDDGYMYINGKIYQTNDYKKFVDEGYVKPENVRNQINILKQAIEESPRLGINAILHRYGHWDEGTKVGDVIVQKGFASTSFSEEVSEDFDEDSKRYKITYYAPATTKGLLLNDQFDAFPEEEWLTGPGTRQYTLNINDYEQEVTVLILPE